jgi:hypothetical protein
MTPRVPCRPPEPPTTQDGPPLPPGPPCRTGEIVWTFNRAGAFKFACLIAGHYTAGMVGDIIVETP